MEAHRRFSIARVTSVALALFAAANLANAQTADATAKRTIQLPQQVIPTGEEDAPAASASRAAATSRAAIPDVELQKQRLVTELIDMTDQSSEGLATARRADGGMSIDLEGRFMSVAIATPTEAGGHVVSCHTGEDAIAHAAHTRDIDSGQARKATVEPAAAQRPSVLPTLEEK